MSPVASQSTTTTVDGWRVVVDEHQLRPGDVVPLAELEADPAVGADGPEAEEASHIYAAFPMPERRYEYHGRSEARNSEAEDTAYQRENHCQENQYGCAPEQ